MRKILLGTTAVVGAALLAPGAFAQTTRGGGGAVGQGVPLQTAPGTVGVAPTPLNVGPQAPSTQVTAAPTPAMAGAGGLTIRLGGYFAFTAAGVQDDWDRARSRNSVGGINNANARSRYDMRNDAELNVFVDGRTSNGITYGAVFELQMDNASAGAADGTTVSFDELYGYIGFDGMGTFRFGQEDSAASLLQVRAPASQALGGDAEWDEFIVQTGLADGSPYIMSGINDGSDATKVIYLSPQFAGFDFGMSYANNSYEGERTNVPNSTSSQRDATALENELSAAIRYRGTFGPVGVIAGIGGMWASPQSQNGLGQPFGTVSTGPRPQDIYAYTGGLVLTGYGFSVGGEYTFGQYRGASVGRTAVNAGVDGAQHWLLGATYTMGPLVFGAVYGQGTQGSGTRRLSGTTGGTGANTPVFQDLDDRKQTLWGVGVAYNLAPGLVLFGLYNNISDENVPTSAPVNARYLSGSGASSNTLASFNGSNTRTINIGVVGIRLAF